jgi:DNA polymerase III subunit alpha
MDPKFVHLNLHTEYSISDGIVRIKKLMDACSEKAMPSVAFTDQSNLFALVKFYKAAMASGIKPIIGVDIWLENIKDEREPFKMLLLAQNQDGYHNILKLISRSFVEGQILGVPIVKKAWLQELANGLIALSGGKDGDVGRALLSDDFDLAQQTLKFWQTTFPNRYYLELQRTGRAREDEYLHKALDLAAQLQCPVVATNAVRFLDKQDFEAHEARVCINSGYVLDDPNRPRLYSQQQYLRSPDEMEKLFSDIPESLINSVEIAKRCNVEIVFGETFLPIFPVPAKTTAELYFAEEARAGLKKRLQTNFNVEASDFDQKREEYVKRLEYEIDVINKMGFASYFLIVADFIHWSNQNGIPVGPGRGSGAGSLVAYSLGITGLDPIEHELLFERFLNPERVSLPDFDIDFCVDGRDRVIEYVVKRYGEDKVAQIITYGTMAARAVVRDVGRVLGFPYGFVDKIAKLIPFEIGITLERALKEEELLNQRYKKEDETRTLIDLAMKLEGITRNAGKHAGGVVVAPSALTDFMPLYCETMGEGVVTQFDKDDVEKVGLVKFDFLGLRTLTIINLALQNINNIRKQKGQQPVDIDLLPLDDKKTYQLLQACNTTAVFQLESRISRDLIKRFKPDCFTDLVALVAIIRPGVLQSGMLDEFIDRKRGRARITYLHPKLEPILCPTYGVVVYQEQVMQMAQSLAGYSLGAADLLRRAMGKKKPEEMALQRAVFIEGAAKNSIDKHLANTIFDLMEKFAGYGFNKSHSAAYALIAYQTAWLKAHYTADFMAAVLSSDMDNTDKVVLFLNDCKNLGLKIIPPNINSSNYQFTVDADDEANEVENQGEENLDPSSLEFQLGGKEKAIGVHSSCMTVANDEANNAENQNAKGIKGILYGLGAIKGVGQAALDIVLATRESQGPFKDLFDLCKRVDTRKVNKRVIEALIYAGALDEVGPSRASQIATLGIAMRAADQHERHNASGQTDLFSELSPEEDSMTIDYVAVDDWTKAERLQHEKDVLGFYLNGHPIEQFSSELDEFISANISELVPEVNKTVLIAGFVSKLKIVTTKSGNRLAIITLEDMTASIDVTMYAENFTDAREFLVEGQLVIVEGEVSVDTFSDGYRIRATKAMNLDQARLMYARGIVLKLDIEQISDDGLHVLYDILSGYCDGDCPVFIAYNNGEAVAKLALGDKWKVQPCEELLVKLKNQFGPTGVSLVYG